MKNKFSNIILILIGVAVLSLMGGCGEPSIEDRQAALFDIVYKADRAGEGTVDLTEFGMGEEEYIYTGYVSVIDLAPSTDIAGRAEAQIAEKRRRLDERRARERARAAALSN